MKKKHNIPLVIGGTHDLQYSFLKAMDTQSTIINIVNRPDFDTGFDGLKVSSTSVCKVWQEKGHEFHYFAFDRNTVAKSH